MEKHSGLVLVDVFTLQHECEWFLRPLCCPVVVVCLLERAERQVVIAAIGIVRCPALWVAPDSVLEHLVPNKPSAGPSAGGIGPDKMRVKDVRVVHSSQ